jgi:hypothetical protein
MASVVLIASRAVAYQAKAFVVNAVGEVSAEMRAELLLTEEDREFLDRVHKGSSIISPHGRLLAGPLGRGEGILYADADLGDMVGRKIVQDFAEAVPGHDPAPAQAIGPIGAQRHEQAADAGATADHAGDEARVEVPEVACGGPGGATRRGARWRAEGRTEAAARWERRPV